MKSPDYILQDLLAHDAWIRALARRLVSEEHEAEDLAQDTWVVALVKQPRKSIPLRSWLGRVVRNIRAMRHREDAHRKQRELAASKSESSLSVADIVDRERMRIAVGKAVISLDEPYRSAILHRFFENLPPREIATRLDVSVVAVETRLRRGLQKLRARLDRDFGDRKTWCTALLPLTVSTAAEAATATATSAITGALVMSMKVKIGIAVVLALGVAYAFWPRDGGKPQELPDADVSQSRQSVVEKKEGAELIPVKQAKAAAKIEEKEPQAQPAAISLEPTRGSIVGVVTDQDGAPIHGATVRALRFIPCAVELEESTSTKTDRTGRYALKRIRDRCAVEASADGHYCERRLASPYHRVDFVLGTPGAVRGKVVHPKDQSPVVNVQVAIYRWEASYVFGCYGLKNFWRQPPVSMCLSNTSGEYQFSNLRPDSYMLRVLPEESAQTATDEPIIVRSGEVTIKDLQLASALTIAGRITDADTGEPIAGAEVYVNPNRFRQTVTDADGRYEIRGFERDPFDRWMNIMAKGYPRYSTTFGWNTFQKVVTQNFRLQKGAIVRGRVVGPNGPVAGALVSPRRSLLQISDHRWLLPAVKATDEDGGFEVTVRANRPSCVYADHPGLAWGVSEQFTLSAGEEKSGVVVRLGIGGTIEGRVTDPDGKPVDGARIVVKAGRWARRSVFTRADGRYDFEAVPPGTYELQTLPPGLFENGRSPLSGSKHAPVKVTESKYTRVDIELQRGPVITGRVVDPDGRPVEGAVLKARAQMPGINETLIKTLPHERLAESDAAGQFRIEGLWSTEQRYWVTARKLGFDAALASAILPGGPPIVLTLAQYRKVEGRVVYAANGKPVIVFCLLASRVLAPGESRKSRFGSYLDYSRANRPGQFTDSKGRFTIFAKPGKYILSAHTDDGLTADAVAIEIPPAGVVPFTELRAWPAAGLSGQVFTDRNEVVKSGRVIIYDLTASPVKFVKFTSIDEEGRFSFQTLPPGTILAYAEAMDLDGKWRGAARKVILQVGTKPKLDLPVMLGTSVQVVVKSPNGTPVNNTRVTVRRSDGAPFVLQLSRMRMMAEQEQKWRKERPKFPTHREAVEARRKWLKRLEISGSDGRLAPWTLIRGTYNVLATAPGYKPWKKTVRITSGGKQTIEIRLKLE